MSNPQNIHELAKVLVDTTMEVDPEQGFTIDEWDEATTLVTLKLFEFCLMQGWVKPSDWAFQTQPRETNNA